MPPRSPSETPPGPVIAAAPGQKMAASSSTRLLRPRQPQLPAIKPSKAGGKDRQAKPALSKGAAQTRQEPVWACPGPGRAPLSTPVRPEGESHAGALSHSLHQNTSPSITRSLDDSSTTTFPTPPSLPQRFLPPLFASDETALSPARAIDPAPNILSSDWSCLDIWAGLDFSLASPLTATAPPLSLRPNPQSCSAPSPPPTAPTPTPTPAQSLTSPPSPPSPRQLIPGSLGLINARSAITHAVELHDLTLDLQLQVLAITETWLKPSSTACLHDLAPQHYQLISKPRVDRPGGGVALLHHHTVSLSVLPLSPEPATFECLLSKGAPPGQAPILFVTIYHPPSDHHAFLDELQLLLEDLIISHEKIVVWGDFNIHLNDHGDPHTILLDQLMANLKFSQSHVGATHRLGNQIDLIYTLNAPLAAPLITQLPWGDHFLVRASLTHWQTSSSPCNQAPPRKKKLTIRSFSALTPQSFSTIWVPCSRPDLPIDDLDAILHTKLLLARNLFCPLKTINQKSDSHLRNKWFSKDLHLLKAKGRSIYRSWQKSHTRSNLIRWQQHQALYKNAIQMAKRTFVQRTINLSSSSSRELFKLTKALTTTPSQDPPSPQVPDSLCHGLSAFFHNKICAIRSDLDAAPQDPDLAQAQASLRSCVAGSDQPPQQLPPPFSTFRPVSQVEICQAILRMGPSSSILDPLPTNILKSLLTSLLPDITTLVNASLSQGYVPVAWKRGIITPLLKKAGLDPDDFKNYRPISQLRFLARLVEFFATQQLQSHLELHCLLHDCQSGFRPGRSTELAVAEVREVLLRNADHRHSSALILLDLSAAFDTVDHAILITRLKEVAGVTGTAQAWFSSFLSNRGQLVRCGDTLSTETPVLFGVPQGSSLSPVLFNIYMRPLATLLESIGIPFQCYADDTQLMVDLHDSSTQAARVAPGLVLIQEWMRLNKLKLNGDKTELLILPGSRTSPIPSVPWPSSWGAPPSPAPKVRDLGIWISRDLDGSAQSAHSSRTAHHHLNVLLKIFPSLTHLQKISLYHAFVHSRLTYGISCLLGAPAKTLYQVQKVQNRAIRSIFRLPWRSHITPWRLKLGWLSIASLIIYRTCLWLWKAYHHHGPSYTHTWAAVRNHNRPMRSGHLDKLQPLTIKKSRKGGRTIAYKGVQHWNALPPALRAIKSFPVFKTALKNHLLAQDSTQSAPVAPPPTHQLQPRPHAGPRPRPLLGPQPLTGTCPRPDPSPAQLQLKLAASPLLCSASADPGLFIPSSPNHCWGVSSPPLPLRNNTVLISRMAANKQRLRATGYYPT